MAVWTGENIILLLSDISQLILWHVFSVVCWSGTCCFCRRVWTSSWESKWLCASWQCTACTKTCV